jgi:hypothetical protein
LPGQGLRGDFGSPLMLTQLVSAKDAPEPRTNKLAAGKSRGEVSIRNLESKFLQFIQQFLLRRDLLLLIVVET